jgi:phage replication-related protein YjqB (UPF0714/DUF867 family)
MADIYQTFGDLAESEREGRDFRVTLRSRHSRTAIVAPHGGAIEPGTSEIASAVAGEDLSFYAFEGLKPSHNSDLHITSPHFDEPRCLALIATAERVVTIHGKAGDGEDICLGGLDAAAIERIRHELAARGFEIDDSGIPGLQGREPLNICNRGSSGAGVQLEIAHGLRRSLFATLDGAGRGRPTRRFGDFVAAIRAALP